MPEIPGGQEAPASPDVEWRELVDRVEHFGLSERESVLYLSLLRRGRATARELAGDVGVDRVLSYRLLDAMCARGIVEITVERPRRYAPVPPLQFFERNLEERRRSLAHDERMAAELAVRISRMASTRTDEAARFRVLTGNRAAYGYLREMMGRSRHEVAVMTTHHALRDSADQGLPGAVLDLLRRGGRFRLIVEADPRVRPMLTRYLSALTKFPHGEVRYLAPQSARLTIVDHDEALVFLVPEARPRGIDQVAMWTNTSEFVEGQLHQFNVIWEVAGRSMEPPRAPRPRRGRRPASSPMARKV
ncbi:MAG: helix-turn-helix domain-containing protein [Thermoplasmata archaeon]